MEKKWYVLITALALTGIIGFFKYRTGYIKDLFFTFFLTIVLFLLYKKIRLTPISYSLVCVALLTHNLGSFGFYASNPLGIPYDYITHIFGVFSATLVAGNFLSYTLTKHNKAHFNAPLVLFIIFLAGLGIGSLAETIEFAGYLRWGEGEGFFQFGTGDYEELSSIERLTQIVGGGYFDAMEDLICNIIGALFAVMLFSVNFFIFKKQFV